MKSVFGFLSASCRNASQVSAVYISDTQEFHLLPRTLKWGSVQPACWVASPSPSYKLSSHWNLDNVHHSYDIISGSIKLSLVNSSFHSTESPFCPQVLHHLIQKCRQISLVLDSLTSPPPFLPSPLLTYCAILIN